MPVAHAVTGIFLLRGRPGCLGRQAASLLNRQAECLSSGSGEPPDFRCNLQSAIYNLQFRGGIAQLVERQLCKLEVRGSNPLASKAAGVEAKSDKGTQYRMG